MNLSSHFKKNLSLAIPVMITQAGQVIVNIADSIMVGSLGGENDIIRDVELGKLALGAVALGNSIFFPIIILGIDLSFAMSPLIAEADAQKNKTRGAAVFSHGLILNTLMAILLFFVIKISYPLLNYLEQPKEVIELAIPYLEIMAISMFPIMVFQSLRQMSEGLSLTKIVAFSTIFANLVNIFLNYGWIYGNFGFPRLEVEGAAYGTLVARLVMLVIILVLLNQNNKTKSYLKLFNLRKLHSSLFQKMIKLGVPSAFQMFFEVAAFGLAAFICGKVGKADLAAHQIAFNVVATTFMLCTGLAVSATIRVGNQLGLKDKSTLKQAAFSNLYMALIFMFICGFLFILLKNIIPRWYVDNLEVIRIASPLLIIAALFQLSDGVQLIILGALRGMQDVFVPSLISLFAYIIIAIPLGYYLAIEHKIGAFGVWAGLGAGLTISAIALYFRLRYKIDRLRF